MDERGPINSQFQQNPAFHLLMTLSQKEKTLMQHEIHPHDSGSIQCE